MLNIDSLVVGYGATVVVHEVSMHVTEGEVIGVFGRNGAGKSTILKALMGSPRPKGGTITIAGRRTERLRTDSIARHGVGMVPQECGVFEQQTVDDNLELALFRSGLRSRSRRDRLADAYDRFPRLAERRHQLGGSLSGGERRMLAIARVLVRQPSVLLLDEPSIGLAPRIVNELQRIIGSLHSAGMVIVIAEQNVKWVLPLISRAYVLDAGRVVDSVLAEDVTTDAVMIDHYLGRKRSAGSHEPPSRKVRFAQVSAAEAMAPAPERSNTRG